VRKYIQHVSSSTYRIWLLMLLYITIVGALAIVQ